MNKKTDKTTEPTHTNLDEAIRQIYEQYGPDLPAFFRDVCNGITLERQKSETNKNAKGAVEELHR